MHLQWILPACLPGTHCHSAPLISQLCSPSSMKIPLGVTWASGWPFLALGGHPGPESCCVAVTLVCHCWGPVDRIPSPSQGDPTSNSAPMGRPHPPLLAAADPPHLVHIPSARMRMWVTPDRHESCLEKAVTQSPEHRGCRDPGEPLRESKEPASWGSPVLRKPELSTTQVAAESALCSSEPDSSPARWSIPHGLASLCPAAQDSDTGQAHVSGWQSRAPPAISLLLHCSGSLLLNLEAEAMSRSPTKSRGISGQSGRWMVAEPRVWPVACNWLLV